MRMDSLARAAAAALAISVSSGCAASWSPSIQEQRQAWQRAELRAASEAASEDPFAGAAVLERAALVNAVLARNPSLQAALQAWRAALERAPQESALDDPMLGFGVAPLSFDEGDLDPGMRVDISQRLPFFGKRGLRGEVAAAEAEIASRDFEAARLRLAQTASRLFDEYYLAARSLEINQEHVRLLGELQRVATARYEAGEAMQQDPLQAEVEYSHALHRDIVLTTRERVAAEQIQTLLHRPPDAPLPPPPAQLVLPPEAQEDAEALVAGALAARPDVAAADARVRAGESRVDLARREFLPDFTVSAAYDTTWQETALQPFVGLSFDLPVQIGRRRAALAQAQAELAGAQSERDARVDEARFGVRSASLREREARHVLHLMEAQQLPAARDQVEAARSGFVTGRGEFFSLIDAQRSLLGIELEVEEARADVCRRRAELDRARGRVAGVDW